MITSAEALDFCIKFYRKNGRPFSVKGRDWVREELFEPALGWKLWPRDRDNLCDKHAAQTGRIVDWSPETVKTVSRKQKCCAGLSLEKITIVVLNLQRGAGKTTNTCALVTALLAKVPKMHVSFIASAGQQARTIADENIIQAVQSHPTLRKYFTLKGNKLSFHRKHGKSSFFEVLDSSPGSAAGRRRNFLFFDEGRDIDAKVLTHMLPSVNAQSRFECPFGHEVLQYEPDKTPKCSECKRFMVPVIPVVVVTSTSGIRTGGSRDWFDEMVEVLSDDLPANAHLYRDSDAANPDANETERGLLETFRKVPSLQEYMDAELDNIPMVAGEGLVESAEVRLCTDQTLSNLLTCELPSFAFLDTSRVGDLTSLVILSEDPASHTPWDSAIVTHVAYWNPRDRMQVPSGVIDETVILPYLERVLAGYPNMIKMHVDTRGVREDNPWPFRFVNAVRSGEYLRTMRTKTHGFKGLFNSFDNQKARAAAWAQLEYRIKAGKIRWPPHQILERELRGVQKRINQKGLLEVKDKARKSQHADIADALAMCCYMSWRHVREVTVEQVQRSPLVQQFTHRGITGGVSESDF